jgi:hypothetical protein
MAGRFRHAEVVELALREREVDEPLRVPGVGLGYAGPSGALMFVAGGVELVELPAVLVDGVEGSNG